MRPETEREDLIRASVARFRRAIRLRPEFDRACYNLGTVVYSHAFALQSLAQASLSSQLTKVVIRGVRGIMQTNLQVLASLVMIRVSAAAP